MIAVADVLDQDRLAGARRGDDQRPLALAERREQIHHARGDRLLAGFQLEPFFGIDRRQLVERFDFRVVVGRHAVDVERSPSAAGPGRGDAAGPCRVISTPSRRPNFSIIVPGTNGSVRSRVKLAAGIAEEAVAVGVHFQHAGAGDERQRSPFSLGSKSWRSWRSVCGP